MRGPEIEKLSGSDSNMRSWFHDSTLFCFGIQTVIRDHIFMVPVSFVFALIKPEDCRLGWGESNRIFSLEFPHSFFRTTIITTTRRFLGSAF